MNEYDDQVLDAFLEKQRQLYDEPVAATRQEAEDYLEMVMAVVVDSADEVWDYFDEEGIDMDGADKKEILNADEVFEVGDGRYLIVEA